MTVSGLPPTRSPLLTPVRINRLLFPPSPLHTFRAMPNGLTRLRMQLSQREMNETSDSADKLIKATQVGTHCSKLHAKPYKNLFGNCLDFEKPKSFLRKRQLRWRKRETLADGVGIKEIKYVSTTSVCYCHNDIIIDYSRTLDCEHNPFQKRACNPKHSYIKVNFPIRNN